MHFLYSIQLLAQTNGSTLIVKKAQWKISIVSTDSILWIGKDNVLDIKVEGGKNYCIKIDGGIFYTFNNRYVVKVKTEGAATITVFEKLPKDKKRVLYSKMYIIKNMPAPIIKVCGVAPDSVIDKKQLIAENSITVYDPNQNMYLKVIGFSLIISSGGVINNFVSNNCHFTINMRNKIHLLKNGSLLYFEDIYCLMPDNTIKKLNDFQLYVSDSEKYRIAYSRGE